MQTASEKFKAEVLDVAEELLQKEWEIRWGIESDWWMEQCSTCGGTGFVLEAEFRDSPLTGFQQQLVQTRNILLDRVSPRAKCGRCDGVPVKCPIMPTDDELRLVEVVNAMQSVYERIKAIEEKPRLHMTFILPCGSEGFISHAEFGGRVGIRITKDELSHNAVVRHVDDPVTHCLYSDRGIVHYGKSAFLRAYYPHAEEIARREGLKDRMMSLIGQECKIDPEVLREIWFWKPKEQQA